MEELRMINKLKKDENLYNIFIEICKFSTRRSFENTGFAKALPFIVLEGIETLQQNGIQKSKEIIKSYITTLIEYKLIKFDNENKENDNVGYDSEIILTGRSLNELTGVNVYRKIILDEEDEVRIREVKESFECGVNEVLEPYRKKLEEVDKKIDDGIIKNIQVISIFAGIIALLFTNVLGIKEFNIIGAKGLLYVNASITMTIFAFIVFTRQLIINRQFDLKSLGKCILVLLMTFLPIIIFMYL
ncbi:hypothetical protein FDF12_14900 [Clostridium botulinum]|nr:hypothetical protein [Clostridium botulinum]NFS54512.1 hypothetical protein [Clostridium botulinum]NFT18625.1 hypothetical protein [Clostridium botulinum]